jgi:TolA-binding protein
MGEEWYNTTNAMSFLGQLYQRQRRYAEAEPFLSRLIQNYGDVFSLGCRSQAFGI